jgi:quinol monooxygenase YgiN
MCSRHCVAAEGRNAIDPPEVLAGRAAARDERRVETGSTSYGAAYAPTVIVVNRFRVPAVQQTQFREDLQRARETLAERPGHLSGRVGRNIDDPELWVLTTEWESVGAYRRALSAYDVKLTAVPVLSRALEEPSAYELVEPGTELNSASARSLR